MGSWLKKIFKGRRGQKTEPSLVELYNAFLNSKDNSSVTEIDVDDFISNLSELDNGVSIFPVTQTLCYTSPFFFIPNATLNVIETYDTVISKMLIPFALSDEKKVDGKFSMTSPKTIPIPFSNDSIAGLKSDIDGCKIVKIDCNNILLYLLISIKEYKKINKQIVEVKDMFNTTLDFMSDGKWSDAAQNKSVNNSSLFFCNAFLMPDTIPMVPENLITNWGTIKEPEEIDSIGVWYTLIYQFGAKKVPVSYYFKSKEHGSLDKLKKVIPGFMKLVAARIKQKSVDIGLAITPVGGKIDLPPKNRDVTIQFEGSLKSNNFKMQFDIYLPKLFSKLLIEHLFSEEKVKYILESIGNWLLIFECIEKKIIYDQIEKVVKPVYIEAKSKIPSNLNDFFLMYGTNAVLLADLIDIFTEKDIRLILDQLSVNKLYDKGYDSFSLFYYVNEKNNLVPASYFNEQRIISNMGLYKQDLWNIKNKSAALRKIDLYSLNLEVMLEFTKQVLKGKSNLSWRSRTILIANYKGFFERLNDLLEKVSLDLINILISIENPQILLRGLSVYELAIIFFLHKNQISWLKNYISSQKYEDIGYRMTNILRDLESGLSVPDDIYNDIITLIEKVRKFNAAEDEEKIG